MLNLELSRINNEYTTKNSDFLKKNDESILDVITKNLWKHTKFQLSNRTGGGVLDILTVYASSLKRSFIDVKNDEGVVIL